MEEVGEGYKSEGGGSFTRLIGLIFSYEFTKYNTLPCELASSGAPSRGSTVVCFLSCLSCEVLLQILATEFGAVLVCVHRTGPLVPALQEQKSQQNMSSGKKFKTSHTHPTHQNYKDLRDLTFSQTDNGSPKPE